MYNLYAVINSETFAEVPLNTCGLATSVLTTATSPTISCNTWSCAYSDASCSYYCYIIAYKSKSFQLIVYGGDVVVGVESSRDGVDSSNWYSESTDPMLYLLPNSYSELDVFLSKS